jgi:hypothetical protein
MLMLECTEEGFNNFNVVPTSSSEQGQLVGTREYCVECSGFIKCGEFLDYPKNCISQGLFHRISGGSSIQVSLEMGGNNRIGPMLIAFYRIPS